jgi:hypothetical protein
MECDREIRRVEGLWQVVDRQHSVDAKR